MKKQNFIATKNLQKVPKKKSSAYKTIPAKTKGKVSRPSRVDR